jgi:CIC family chloride channel protein
LSLSPNTPPTKPDVPAAQPLAKTSHEPPPRLLSSPRRSLFVRATAVGLVSGLAAVGFRLALEQAEKLRDFVMAIAGRTNWGLAIAAGFAAVLAGAGVALVRRMAPEAAGSGIPHVEGVLHNGFSFHWLRVLWVKVVGGILSIGGGLALGREGPTIQIGASVGRAGGLWLGSNPEEERTLIAVGAAAGLAAAFNAPLAGMMFFFEELRGGDRPDDYLAALLASAAGDLLARGLLGQGPVFGAIPVIAPPPLEVIPLAVGIGVAGRLVGVLFNVTLFRTLAAFGRARDTIGGWQLAAIIGLLIGLFGWFHPELLGDGHRLIGSALSAPPVLTAVLSLIAVRAILTLGSYATGAAGGLFSPLLVLGAHMGAVCSLFPAAGPLLPVCVVLGMAGLFTGSIRAPVTGILLMVEMSGCYALVLPLLATCLVSEFVAGELGGKPIYTALLERDLVARAKGNSIGFVKK